MIHYVKLGVKGIDDDINQIEPTTHMITFQHTLSMATPGTDLRIMRILRDASDSSRGEGRHPSPLYSVLHVNTGLVPPTYPLVHNQAQSCSLWLTVNTQNPYICLHGNLCFLRTKTAFVINPTGVCSDLSTERSLRHASLWDL